MLKEKSIRFLPETIYANERDELIKFAHEQFEMLFDVMRLAQGSSSHGAKVITIGKTTRATACVTTRIHATISEVSDIFCSEHTHYATGFSQSQQIYSLLTPSNKHPMRSAALRWSLWDTPSKMVRNRDIVYVEYMDEFVDENNRRGWARCTHSIDHRSCPPLENTHDVVRAHLYCSGSLYKETDEPGVLEVVTLVDVDTRGVPGWISKMIASRTAQSVTSVEHLIRLSRVMSDEDDPEIKLIEFQIKGRACHGCGDRLSKWPSSRKCTHCKESICKSCSEVVYYNSDERKKLKNICIYCVDDEITDGEQRGDPLFSGFDTIRENGIQATRRMHHMSFRSLRMTRETNFSISPTASERSGFSYSSSSSRSNTNCSRGMYRIASDPGMRLGSRSQRMPSALRLSKSIPV